MLRTAKTSPLPCLVCSNSHKIEKQGVTVSFVFMTRVQIFRVAEVRS